MDREPRLPLAFGERNATRWTSLLDLTEATRKVFPSLRDYDASSAKTFVTHTVDASINNLTPLAATLPRGQTTATVDGYSRLTFVFHLHGVCEFQIDGKPFYARAHASTVLIPENCSWTVHALHPSTVTVSIGTERLRETAQTMLGSDTELSNEAMLTTPLELPLTFATVSFNPIFQQNLSQIDLYIGRQTLLDASGLDDILCRAVIISAMPDRFVKESEAREITTTKRQVQRVCDYVMSELGNPISLTHLERFGHMSRRTLHNSFKRTFGKSPMAWVREQRLIKAHRLLTKPKSKATVTQIVYECGFTDASLFSSYYLHRFGEYPSVTLARARLGG